MFFKKVALFMLTLLLAGGFYGTTALAAANDETEIETTIEDIQTLADAASADTTGSEETVSGADEDGQLTEDVSDAAQTADAATSAAAKAKTTTAKKTTKTKKSTSKKTQKKDKYTKSELRLMASIINCEAGGESMQGKLAVGVVIMNRVASKKFPNTIKKVIYQRGQFSPVRNGSLKKKLSQYDAGKTHSKQWKACISAAKKVLQGQRTIIYKGKVKSMKGYHFFSVTLPHARLKLGGHRFK